MQVVVLVSVSGLTIHVDTGLLSVLCVNARALVTVGVPAAWGNAIYICQNTVGSQEGR